MPELLKMSIEDFILLMDSITDDAINAGYYNADFISMVDLFDVYYHWVTL